MTSIFTPFRTVILGVLAFARAVSVEASFDPHSPRLHPAVERVIQDAAWAAGGRGFVPPYAIFDLDETVIDSTPRRLRAYQIAVGKLCLEDTSAEARQACPVLARIDLSLIRSQRNRYDHAEMLRALSLPSSDFTERLEKAMCNEYLSGRHLELDVAIPGAVETVRQLLENQAKVYFVSSRYEDTQLAGTLDSLKSLGFLQTGDHAEVILRRRGEVSLDFKKRAFEGIAQEMAAIGGLAVGVFENEPENLNAMKKMFPTAQPIFIEGAMMNPIPIDGHASRLRDYHTGATATGFLETTPLRSEIRVP